MAGVIDDCDDCGQEDQLTRCPCGEFLCDPCYERHDAIHHRLSDEAEDYQ